jgi:hypothetical protein
MDTTCGTTTGWSSSGNALPAAGRWRGTHVSVQVHRIDEIGYEIPQVVAEHGTASDRVAFDEPNAPS